MTSPRRPEEDDALTPAERSLLAKWQVADAEPDLAHAVFERLEAEARARRRRRAGMTAAVLVVAGVGAALFGSGHIAVPDGGDASALAARETVLMGRRGVAVLEPAAAIRWHTDLMGGTVVEQLRGNVFYRVEPGGPFVVQTPAGAVRVVGTCFRVEIPQMKPALAGAAGTALGAVAASVAWVAVFEGRVLASGEGQAQEQEIMAGEEVRLTAGRGVERAGATAARAGAAGKRSEADAARDTAALLRRLQDSHENCVNEAAQLADELEDASRLLRNAEEQKKAEEGEPIPFPKDLPAKYTKAEVLKNFEEALAQAGVAAEATTIDCAEYPCIACADMAMPATTDGMPDMHTVNGNAKRIGESPALSTYGNGEEFRWIAARANGDRPEDAAQRQTGTLCEAFYMEPGSAAAKEEIQKRLKWRLSQQQTDGE